jgi:hypothetical protein
MEEKRFPRKLLVWLALVREAITMGVNSLKLTRFGDPQLGHAKATICLYNTSILPFRVIGEDWLMSDMELSLTQQLRSAVI